MTLLEVEIPARLPAYPRRLQALIRCMANENPSWGEERIANDLQLRLNIHVSSRAARKHMPLRPAARPRRDLFWSTFLRLHAWEAMACDFVVVLTAAFLMLYALVVIEHCSRRFVHWHVTVRADRDFNLRMRHGQHPPGVLGLGDSFNGIASAVDSEALDHALQRRGPHMALGPGLACSPIHFEYVRPL